MVVKAILPRNEGNEILLKSFEAGANDYIKKPFSNEFELMTRIKNLLIINLRNHQLKLKENELIENERMMFQQSKHVAMGEMLENIAHQWRQPLSVISAAASGMKLKQETGILKEKDIILYSSGIVKHTQYLSKIIDDFREFNEPSKQKESLYLHDLIEKNLSLLESAFEAKNIKIINEIKPIEFSGHKNELMQVIINILNNAKDALESRGITDSIIILDSYTDAKNIIISIQDNAKGIEEDVIKKIFNPYFTTKHKSQGTGLGLYMSKVIIEKSLYGTLRVCNKNFIYDNKEYKGAEFLISLPIDIPKIF